MSVTWPAVRGVDTVTEAGERRAVQEKGKLQTLGRMQGVSAPRPSEGHFGHGPSEAGSSERQATA